MQKRGIANSVIVKYVLAVIIIVFILVLGYNMIDGMMQRQKEVAKMQMRDSLKVSVSSLSSLDYGSVENREFKISDDFDRICFTSTTNKTELPGLFIEDYPLAANAVEVGYNALLIGDTIEGFNVGNLRLPNNLVCIPIEEGKLELSILGLGDAAGIKPQKSTVQKINISSGQASGDFYLLASDYSAEIEIIKGTLIDMPDDSKDQISIQTKDSSVYDNEYIQSAVVDFKPDGTTFDPPIPITLSYDARTVDNPLLLRIHYYNGSDWIALDGPFYVDTEKHTITGYTSHFSEFAALLNSGLSMDNLGQLLNGLGSTASNMLGTFTSGANTDTLSMLTGQVGSYGVGTNYDQLLSYANMYGSSYGGLYNPSGVETIPARSAYYANYALNGIGASQGYSFYQPNIPDTSAIMNQNFLNIFDDTFGQLMNGGIRQKIINLLPNLGDIVSGNPTAALCAKNTIALPICYRKGIFDPDICALGNYCLLDDYRDYCASNGMACDSPWETAYAYPAKVQPGFDGLYIAYCDEAGSCKMKTTDFNSGNILSGFGQLRNNLCDEDDYYCRKGDKAGQGVISSGVIDLYEVEYKKINGGTGNYTPRNQTVSGSGFLSTIGTWFDNITSNIRDFFGGVRGHRNNDVEDGNNTADDTNTTIEPEQEICPHDDDQLELIKGGYSYNWKYSWSACDEDIGARVYIVCSDKQITLDTIRIKAETSKDNQGVRKTTKDCYGVCVDFGEDICCRREGEDSLVLCQSEWTYDGGCAFRFNGTYSLYDNQKYCISPARDVTDNRSEATECTWVEERSCNPEEEGCMSGPADNKTRVDYCAYENCYAGDRVYAQANDKYNWSYFEVCFIV